MAKKQYLDLEGLETLVDEIKVLLADKANSSTLSSHTSNKSNPHAVTAFQVGAYTKAEVDAYSFITTDDIDAICGTFIQNASEVTY